MFVPNNGTYSIRTTFDVDRTSIVHCLLTRNRTKSAVMNGYPGSTLLVADPSSNGSTPTSDCFSFESVYSTLHHSGGLPLAERISDPLLRCDIADRDVYKQECGTVRCG